MRTPLLTDMDEIRRMSEALAEAEREKFHSGADPGNGPDQDQAAADPDPLSFPPVMAGVAGDFAETFSSVLEPPKHFFYAAYMACLGSVLADRIVV